MLELSTEDLFGRQSLPSSASGSAAAVVAAPAPSAGGRPPLTLAAPLEWPRVAGA
jgi:hypothetical protein